MRRWATWLQQRVAGFMAERVVDRLEPIEVDHEQRERAAAGDPPGRWPARCDPPAARGSAGPVSASCVAEVLSCALARSQLLAAWARARCEVRVVEQQDQM